MRRNTAVALILVVVVLAFGGAALYHYMPSQWSPAKPRPTASYIPPAPLKTLKPRGERTVSHVLDVCERAVRARLLPAFLKAGVPYLPDRVVLLGLKEERILELWAFAGVRWRFVKDYPIKGASGGPGPKLRQGDRQVPEGIYRISYLNPNSKYHLSMKINYPNAFDRLYAKKDKRLKPGDNIFIHGKDVSIGCLAMGDKAVEELFVLAAKLGRDRIKVVIAPRDPRKAALDRSFPGAPNWLPKLYRQIEDEFDLYATDGSRPERIARP